MGSPGEPIDLFEDGDGTVGGEVASDQIGRAIGVGLCHHSSVSETALVAPLGVGGVDPKAKGAKPGGYLTSGQLACFLEDGVRDATAVSGSRWNVF